MEIEISPESVLIDDIDRSSEMECRAGLTSNKKYHYDKRWVCDWPGCQRRYQHYSQLFRHQLSHRRSFRSCPWPECDYKTAHLDLLKGHVRRVHGAELPLYCEWPDCQFVAEDKNMLQTHKKLCEFRPRQSMVRRPYKGCEQTKRRNEAEERISLSSIKVEEKDSVSDDEFIKEVYSDDDDDDSDIETDRKMFKACFETLNRLVTVRRELNVKTNYYQTYLARTKRSRRLKKFPKKQPNRISFSEYMKDLKLKELQRELNRLRASMGKPVVIWMAGPNDQLGRFENGQYFCSWTDCDFKCTSRENLMIHRRRHTGELPFTCDWPGCEYKAISNKNLNKHKQNHLGVRKESACSWPGCDYVAKGSYQLKLHQAKVHSVGADMLPVKIKKYVCDWPGCDYRCFKKERIERHRRGHTGEKPFECTWPGCDFRCAGRENLMMHLKRKHKMGIAFKPQQQQQQLEPQQQQDQLQELKEIPNQSYQLHVDESEEIGLDSYSSSPTRKRHPAGNRRTEVIEERHLRNRRF